MRFPLTKQSWTWLPQLRKSAAFLGLILGFAFLGTSALYALDHTAAKDFVQGAHPFLLPANHPIRSALDTLCRNPKDFASRKAMLAAGFECGSSTGKLFPWNIEVLSHPHLKESNGQQYLVKTFPLQPNDEKYYAERAFTFVRRCRNSQRLKQYVASHRFTQILVPRKWIYRLGRSFEDKETPYGRYLLVVEKIPILFGHWEDPDSPLMQAYQQLDRKTVYEATAILADLNGCDAYPDNVAATPDGKLAFIDLDRLGTNREDFAKHFLPHLSPQMQPYARHEWEKRQKGGGHNALILSKGPAACHHLP